LSLLIQDVVLCDLLRGLLQDFEGRPLLALGVVRRVRGLILDNVEFLVLGRHMLEVSFHGQVVAENVGPRLLHVLVLLVVMAVNDLRVHHSHLISLLGLVVIREANLRIGTVLDVGRAVALVSVFVFWRARVGRTIILTLHFVVAWWSTHPVDTGVVILVMEVANLSSGLLSRG